MKLYISSCFCIVDEVEQDLDRTGLFDWLQMGTAISAVLGALFAGLVIDDFDF